MLEKLKKFFLFLPKRKIFFVFLILALFNFLFFPLSASAGVWEKLANLPLTIPSALLAAIAWIVAELTVFVLVFANFFLSWVISPDFAKLPYTKPGPILADGTIMGNPIIETGLSITQGFVNMLLVLILVYIAIATILRLGGYETKKLLVTFIVVALLVNFTHIICGLIVDASNIVMNFFIKGIGESGGAGLVNNLSNVGKTFTAGFLDAMFDFKLMAEKIMKLALMTVLNLLVAFAFFIFAFIFIARYIVIWVLVILSPLAFACYILPITRSYWRQWWQQFLAWSFIGVTCGFFLYLGMRVSELLTAGVFAAPIGLGSTILPYLVPVVFLFIGLIYGLQTSAKGASAVMNLTKRAGRATGKFAAKQTAGRFLASETGKKFLEKAKIPTTREALKMEAHGLWGKVGKGAAVAGTALATMSGARWALRGVSYTGARYGAAQESRVEDTKKKIEQQFGKDYERAAMSYGSILPGNYHKKIALSRYLAETKGAKALNKLAPKELEESIKLTTSYSPKKLEDLIKHKPELIDDSKIGDVIKNNMVPEKMDDSDVKELIKLGVEPAEAIRKAAFKKAVEALKESDIPQLSDSTIEKPEFQEMVARYKPWGFIRKIGEEKGRDYIDKIQDSAEKIFPQIAITNPSFLRSPYTPAGQLFLRQWEDKKTSKKIKRMDEINTIIQEASSQYKQKQTPPPTPPPPKTSPTTIKEELKESKEKGLPTIGQELKKKKK